MSGRPPRRRAPGADRTDRRTDERAAGGAAGRTRRVLVAHPSADLYGSDRVLLESVAGLVDAGWDVVVTLPAPGPLVARIESRGARVALCPSPVLRKSLLSTRGLVRLVRQAATGLRQGDRLLRRVRPHAVYVNTVTVPLWLVVARLRRVPVLCHVHEAEGSAPRWVRAVLALPVLLADVVVANSAFSIGVLAGSFRRLGRRSRLVLNGVPGPAERTKARASLEGPVRVVYVGRLSPRKGVDVAVDAVAALAASGTPATLDVVGAPFPGYEWYERQLEGQVHRLGLDGRVRLHGFRDVVWDVVQGGDVVVVPSRVDEPFGNTAVEAVLCGRPVVASATSGLLEATAGYRSAQTVPPGDPDALAAAIGRVAADWDRWRADAWSDADEAAERHAPEVYRAHVARVVGQLVDR